MNSDIYSPFDGDGRIRRAPMIVLPNTQPMAVTNAQARRIIDNFIETGHTTHSLAGGTLWVVLYWCQVHKMHYRLSAIPGAGYYVEKQK